MKNLLPPSNPSTPIRALSVARGLACGLAALLFFAGGTARAGEAVIARMGDVEVKADDIRSFLEAISPQEQAALAKNPAALNQNIRLILAQQMVLKEAFAKQWERRPEVVAQMERARKNMIFESYLSSVSNPPDNYPSPAEVQSVYEANKEALQIPRQFRLAQIFIAVPHDTDREASERARARLEAIRKQPASFELAARNESEDKLSKGRGGEIGWTTEEQIQPEIRTRVLTLARGAIAEPVRLKDGWHLIKLLDVREARTPTLEEVRAGLVQRLRAERTRVNSQTYLTKLLQETPVTINEIAVAQELDALARKARP